VATPSTTHIYALSLHDALPIFARVPDAQAEDVDAAVRSARATFESAEWQDMLPAQREMLMLRLADLIEKNGEELARLETLNNGRSEEHTSELQSRENLVCRLLL